LKSRASRSESGLAGAAAADSLVGSFLDLLSSEEFDEEEEEEEEDDDDDDDELL